MKFFEHVPSPYGPSARAHVPRLEKTRLRCVPTLPADTLLLDPRQGRRRSSVNSDNTLSRPVKCLKGSQLIVNLSLLYLSRHPGFVRKSSSGGLPCGALGHRKISTREMRRVVVVVLVAEPFATHSQGNFLSVHGHSPIRPPQAAGSPSADSVAGRRGSLLRNTFGRFPALRTQ